MVDTLALRGLIVAKGESQRSIAKKINMPESSFYKKMYHNTFNSGDLNALRHALQMDDTTAIRIFFADGVAQKSTGRRYTK